MLHEEVPDTLYGAASRHWRYFIFIWTFPVCLFVAPLLLPGFAEHVRAYFFLLIAPVLWLTGHGGAMQSYYQSQLSGLPWNTFLDLFGWEFFFRGFILFAYARRYGPDALWLQAVPFALAHIGKPEVETFSTIFGGFAFGWVAYRKGLYDAAVPALEQAVKLAADRPGYHYHLGMAYLKANDWTKARASLQQALKLRPDFPGAEDARKALASIQ